jgi:cytochrome c-type biogenesis protein
MLTSLSLGLLATTSPCVLPLYPGFLAYICGGEARSEHWPGRYFLGFFVLAGVLVMMLVFGLALSILSISIGRVLAVILPLADLVILGLGILLLVDFNPFKWFPQIDLPVLSHPFANAFMYGFLYGPIALPCSGPFVVGIFAFSLTAGEAFSKLAVFLWFGLGLGLPLLGLSLLSGSAQRWLTRQFTRHSRAINLIGGLILIGIAVYNLVQNWALLRLYL